VFFASIKDGEWHSIDVLSDSIGLQTSKLIKLSQFFSDHNLLKYDDEKQRIRIKPMWKLFLPEQGKPAEPKTTLATFIIPPETSIDVQSTHISNLSNVELEVCLRFDDKIKEVTIKV
jgi:hypothetical protein